MSWWKGGGYCADVPATRAAKVYGSPLTAKKKHEWKKRQEGPWPCTSATMPPKHDSDDYYEEEDTVVIPVC